MKTKKILLLLIPLFLSLGISAQNEKLISAKKLKKDFKHLVSMIEAHPSPYRHVSEKDLNAFIDSCRNQLREPMSAIDFYKLTSPIFAKIKDGHSSMHIQGKWLTKYRKKNGVFPYKVYITEENRLYIIHNYGKDNTIPLAAEILSLNDIPAAEFIEGISQYLSYEQEIFRNTIIEKKFDLYLLLYFGKVSKIELGYFSNSKGHHVVDYVSYDKWKDEIKEEEELKHKKRNANEPYAFTKIKDGVGLLKIYSFAIYNQDKYDTFLWKMFRKIKKEGIRDLIIDVRGNSGGYPKAVSDLLHYVSEKHFKTMARSEMKVSDAYKQYFIDEAPPAIDFRRLSMKESPHSIDVRRLFEQKTGTQIVEEGLFNESPKKKENEFKGNLYLLIDRRSYSTSSSFAATFRCYQFGLIVGSETGGTRVFYANNMYKKLNHTNLFCTMATTALYTTCFNEADEGIKPDIEVKPTIQHLINKSDIALIYTLRIIGKVRKEEKKD